MSEEENPEVVEQQAEQAKVEEAKSEPNDALYRTLFDIAEDVEEEVQQESYKPPVDLNEAVQTLDHEEEKQEEEKEPEPEPEPEKTEPKKKKLRKVVDPDIPEDVKKQPTYQSTEQEDVYKPDEEEQEFINDLIPEERSVYEKILYADKRMGGEYEGKSKEFKAFIKKNKEFVEKRMKEDDFYDPSADEQYTEFVQKNKPQFTRADEDKVHKEMILEEADRRINKKTNERIQQLEAQLKKYEVMPKINQAKANFRKIAQQTVVPNEYQKEFAEGGEEAIKKFSESNPLEYQILERNTQELLQLSDVLTELFLDPSAQLDIGGNKVHKYLHDWLNTEQDNFIKSGQTQQEDGRVFMRRERYYQLPEDKRSEYYTWSDNDLLKLMALRYGDKVNNEIATHREQMEKAGYRRVEQAAPQEQPKAPEKPPVVNATPRQGSSVETKQAPKEDNAILAALGL